MAYDHEYTYNDYTFNVINSRIRWDNPPFREQEVTYSLQCQIFGQTLDGLRTDFNDMKDKVSQFNKDFTYKINGTTFDEFDSATGAGNISTSISKPEFNGSGTTVEYNVDIKYQLQTGGGGQSRKTGSMKTSVSYDKINRKTITYSRRTRWDSTTYDTPLEQALEYIDNDFDLPSGFEFVSYNSNGDENIWYSTAPTIFWYWTDWSWTIREKNFSDIIPEEAVKELTFNYTRTPTSGNAGNYLIQTSITGSFSVAKSARDTLQSFSDWTAIQSYKDQIETQIYNRLKPQELHLVTGWSFQWDGSRSCNFHIQLEIPSGYKKVFQFKEATIQITMRYDSGIIKRKMSNGDVHLQQIRQPAWTCSAVGSFRSYNKMPPITSREQLASSFTDPGATLTEYEPSYQAPYYIAPGVVEYGAQIRTTWDITDGEPALTYANKLIDGLFVFSSEGGGAMNVAQDKFEGATDANLISQTGAGKAAGGK